MNEYQKMLASVFAVDAWQSSLKKGRLDFGADLPFPQEQPGSKGLPTSREWEVWYRAIGFCHAEPWLRKYFPTLVTNHIPS